MLKPRTTLNPCVPAQSVSLERFETERLLELVPPDGEFAVMNYRSTHPFKPPFRVTCTVEDDPHSAFKARPPPCHAGLTSGRRLGAPAVKTHRWHLASLCASLTPNPVMSVGLGRSVRFHSLRIIAGLTAKHVLFKGI